MGNRRKIKNNLLRMKKRQPKVEARGRAPIGAHEDLVAVLYSQEGLDSRTEVQGQLIWDEDALIKLGLSDPKNDVDGQIIRVVRAKANGIPTGLAFIYDDGNIGYWEDKSSDPEALAAVHKVAEEVGYSLEEGRPFAIGEAGGPDGPPKED